MSREGDTLLRLRRVSTARLQRRRARLERELRSYRDLPVNSLILEELRDELDAVEKILRDRAT